MRDDQPLHPGQIQNWQAVAILKSGREMLVTLGVSNQDVKRRYYDQLAYLADAGVTDIIVRKWDGDHFSGKWVSAGKLDAAKIQQEAQAA